MEDIKVEYSNTSEVKVPPRLIDQVIGQDHATDIISKSAEQRRHVLLIGAPGTGKSLLARSMAEILPPVEVNDVLVYPNPKDENNPVIKTVQSGYGRAIIESFTSGVDAWTIIGSILMVVAVIVLFFALLNYFTIIAGVLVVAIIAAGAFLPRVIGDSNKPKLLVSIEGKKAPFIDATGSHHGALLGDVQHDPLQSGFGLSAHLRVEAGDIHRANGGVLYIDEIANLPMEMQIGLLTALQEGQYAITAHHPQSSGALVKTEPVPCKFVMIAAGNEDAMQRMHPALRSRIRGYGYEVYMDDTMPDTEENRQKLIQFTAQEIKKDGKIPHFDRSAVIEVIREARRRSMKMGRLTLKLRDLGGLIRAAGDAAVKSKSKFVTADHVIKAKGPAQTIEGQIADSRSKDLEVYNDMIGGEPKIGFVNGLAVFGDTGRVLPVIAAAVPGKGEITATGQLKEIAQESVKNVSAVVKAVTGKDVKSMDIFVQFVGTYGGVEGDSASVSIATALVSAMEEIPVRQDVAMTGSLTVRGDVLPIGGVTQKIEAAAKAGIKTVLVPQASLDNVNTEPEFKDVIVIPVRTIYDVFKHALVCDENSEFMKRAQALGSQKQK